LVQRSGKLLVSAGIPPATVDVFVAGEEQADIYRDAVHELGFNLRLTQKGIREARNTIHSSYEEGTRLVVLDDDLTGVDEKVDNRTLRPVTDIAGLANRAFDEAEARGVALWGTYPVRNPLFMKRRVEFGLRFCIGQMYGIVVRKPWLQLRCETKEDYELSILHFQRDGAVMRLDYVTARSLCFKGGGGLQSSGDQARRSMDRRSAQELLTRFPQYVTRKKRSTQRRAEIKLARLDPVGINSAHR